MKLLSGFETHRNLMTKSPMTRSPTLLPDFSSLDFLYTDFLSQLGVPDHLRPPGVALRLWHSWKRKSSQCTEL